MKERTMTRKAHTFRLALTAAVAAALLIVPVATAADPGPDAFERAVNARNADAKQKLSELALSPRAAGPSFSQTSAPVSGPDAFERAVNAHTASLAIIASPGRTAPDVVESIGSTSVTAASDGFDWTAAAIGGSAMLALVLLVSGGALATRSRGRVALR
jgi:hypothetical protein